MQHDIICQHDDQAVLHVCHEVIVRDDRIVLVLLISEEYCVQHYEVDIQEVQ